jgi:hypothetical protein
VWFLVFFFFLIHRMTSRSSCASWFCPNHGAMLAQRALSSLSAFRRYAMNFVSKTYHFLTMKDETRMKWRRVATSLWEPRPSLCLQFAWTIHWYALFILFILLLLLLLLLSSFVIFRKSGFVRLRRDWIGILENYKKALTIFQVWFSLYSATRSNLADHRDAADHLNSSKLWSLSWILLRNRTTMKKSRSSYI